MATTPTLFMHTTKVPSETTALEIQLLLLKNGATDILIQADSGVVTGISFRIRTAHGHLPFRLPANVDKVYAVLCRVDMSKSHGSKTMDQAHRTGWRILKRWVEAQLAMIATEMVTFDQIMLPFLEVDDGATTLYDRFLEDTNRFLALPEGDHGS